MDAVTSDEGPGEWQLLADLDDCRIEPDLLVGLAQRGGGKVGVTCVPASSRERDLSRMAAQVGPALGEDEAGLVRPAVEGQQDSRVDGLATQMITWTVPPSTDQAAPLT
jgi:hypothetical protein